MATGRALIVGLTKTRKRSYDSRKGVEGGAADVRNMRSLVKKKGLLCSTLLDKEATAGSVLRCLENAARKSVAGDLFVFFFAGHGGQRYDSDGDELYDDYDETLCTYDKPIVDDQLGRIWPKFRNRVRIVMISDSCNAGSNARGLDLSPTMASRGWAARGVMQASMLHFGASADGQSSYGDKNGGKFTNALCKVLKAGGGKLTYRTLDTRIQKILGSPQRQDCKLTAWGPGSNEMLAQKPFLIDADTGPGAAPEPDPFPTVIPVPTPGGSLLHPGLGALLGRMSGEPSYRSYEDEEYARELAKATKSLRKSAKSLAKSARIIGEDSW